MLAERFMFASSEKLKTIHAFANANIGIIRRETHPCNECSRFCNGGEVFSANSSISSRTTSLFFVNDPKAWVLLTGNHDIKE